MQTGEIKLLLRLMLVGLLALAIGLLLGGVADAADTGPASYAATVRWAGTVQDGGQFVSWRAPNGKTYVRRVTITAAEYVAGQPITVYLREGKIAGISHR